MAVRNVSTKLSLEGEKEYKSAISDINKDLSTLGSELGKAAAQFALSGDEMGGMRAKADLLNEKIETQKQKISTLKTALESTKDAFGEADSRTKGWQISLNKSEEELAKMQLELNSTNTQIKQYGTNQLKAALDSEEFGKAQDKIKGLLGAVAIAAAAVGAAIVAMASQALESADSLQKMADTTGMSAERLQEIKYAGDDLGVSLDTITSAQMKLTRTMDSARNGQGAAADLFHKMWISVKDANGQLRDSNDVMFEVFDRLKQLGSETDQDAALMTLMGKSAAELNPIIRAGSVEFNRLTAEARASGAVMSNETVAALDAAGDSLDHLKQSLSAKFGEAFAQLAPDIEAFANKIKSIDLTPLMNALSWIMEHAAEIGSLIVGIGAAFLAWKAVEIITAIIGGFQALSTAIAAATVAQEALDVAMLANPIGIVIALVAGLVAAFVILWNTSSGFKDFIIGWGDLIKGIATDIADFCKSIAESVAQFFVNVADSLASFATDIWSGITGVFNDIKNWWNDFWDGLKQTVTDVVDSIKDALGIHSPSKVFADIGMNMAAGLGQGFADTMTGVSKDMTKAVPTSIDMNGSYNVSGSTSGSAGSAGSRPSAQPTVIYLTAISQLDSRQIAKSTHKYLLEENTLKGANLIE